MSEPEIVWGLRNVTTGELLLNLYRRENIARNAAIRMTNRWRRVDHVPLTPLQIIKD